MKKIMMIACMMLMSMGAFAQAGKFAVGANAGVAFYGHSYNPFGIGAKFQYEFVESFRAELAYNYWFPKDKAGVMDIDLNLQYLIPVSEGLYVYPLVGANLAITHGDAAKNIEGKQESIFGFQGGVGIEYYVAENVKINLDAKYQYNKKTKDFHYHDGGIDFKEEIEYKFNGPVIQAGIAYVF